MGTIAGRRWPTGPHGPIAPPAPGPNSIWPSSASFSTPAPAHHGATTIRKPDRRSAVRRDWDWPASRCSPAARFRLIRSIPCGPMPSACKFRRRGTRARLAGLGYQSAGRTSTAAPTCCAASARWWLQSRKYSAATTPRDPAACSIALRHWRRTGNSPPRRFLSELAARTRPDLAVAADARRNRARRLLETSVADDGGRDQRFGAAAQALAMAGLFADRAAANGRHPGDRYRWPYGTCRISQRRPVRRYRRACVSRCRRRATRARSSIVAGRRMACADGGAARPRCRWRAATASGSMPPRCHWQRFSRAEPGPRAGCWRANAVPTLRLR